MKGTIYNKLSISVGLSVTFSLPSVSRRRRFCRLHYFRSAVLEVAFVINIRCVVSLTAHAKDCKV